MEPVKTKSVLVLCTPDKEDEAKAAGADFVGLDDYVGKIMGGWTDVMGHCYTCCHAQDRQNWVAYLSA